MNGWPEYGVLLLDNTIAPAASIGVAAQYVGGHAVAMRWVITTPGLRTGDADVSIGDWAVLTPDRVATELDDLED